MHLDNALVTSVLEIARLAPSVHNTQPWRVSFSGDVISIGIDPKHRLNDGDPTGRQTIISLGIFAEAVVIGLAHHQLKATDVKLEDSHARIKVKGGLTGSKDVAWQVEALKKRATDRSIYRQVSLPDMLQSSLEDCLVGKSTRVQLVTDKTILHTTAKLTGKGIRLALSSPGFRRELSQYLVAPWSGRKRGIATDSLYLPRVIGAFQPWLVRSSSQSGKEAFLETKRWESASGLVFITSSGDMPTYWFDAGRTYLNVSLAIESAGLSQATSAAIVEAADFHEDIEELLGTNQRILAVIRVGKGASNRRYSPRISAHDLLTSS